MKVVFIRLSACLISQTNCPILMEFCKVTLHFKLMNESCFGLYICSLQLQLDVARVGEVRGAYTILVGRPEGTTGKT
jgi:hypothetical protein